MPENVDIYKIYNLCQGQYIMGPNGPIDVNMLAVDSAMDDEHIPKHLRYETKYRVRNLSRHMINLTYEDADGG